jgi:hypothetical protein
MGAERPRSKMPLRDIYHHRRINYLGHLPLQ